MVAGSIKEMELHLKKYLTSRWVWLIGIIIVFGGYGIDRYSYLVIPVTEFQDLDTWVEENNPTREEFVHYTEVLQEAARKDTAGGQTPQETLQLWVDAVKADDLKKASTYFIITRQKNALEGMKESRQNDVLLDVIEDIENGGRWYESDFGTATFDTATLEESKGGENLGFEFTFTKHPETGIWKIDEF